jgi:hypothetical protein
MSTRILRIVRSRLLKCGCLIGVYETYEGASVEILDSQNPSCEDRTHRTGAVMPAYDNRDDNGSGGAGAGF